MLCIEYRGYFIPESYSPFEPSQTYSQLRFTTAIKYKEGKEWYISDSLDDNSTDVPQKVHARWAITPKVEKARG